MVGKEKSVPWINLYHYEDRSVILENLDGESTESMVRYGTIKGSEALYYREGTENVYEKTFRDYSLYRNKMICLCDVKLASTFPP